MTLTDIRDGLLDGSLSSAELVSSYKAAYENGEKKDLPLNAYVEFFDDAIDAAEKADARRRGGDALPLLGLPIAVKDNILVRGREVTCGSRILQGFRAPYSATVVERLLEAGAVILGRTNMDEFAMGSSCEYSCYGPSRNPSDRSRTPGGSSGGSAAAVAGGEAPFALGSDTGGSVRLPASFCGLYGLKPSYGTLSRYGLAAFGSSLDQIGLLGLCPSDLALVLSVAAGRDPRDETSAETCFRGLIPLKPADIKGMRVAVPVQLLGEGTDPEVIAVFESFVSWLKERGASVSEVSVPSLEACVAIYYIIAPAEASSNLARYDGVRYGFRKDSPSLFDMYARTRAEGFGKEVKRRILIGNYVLSSGYYEAYYNKAFDVRKLLSEELENLFASHDLILSPTAPFPAFKIGDKVDDPLSMYLSDLCTIFANLAMIPALSIPAGKSRAGLPVGMQIASRRFAEDGLLSVAEAFYREGKTW
jgi:aspartyl-tRNA(Asn)/glutamyl-tRNA(Gln) amidotransferase subunit A